MEVVYPILIGAGIISMILALFIQRKSPIDSDSATQTHRSIDKAELEKDMQKISRQLKQEHERLSADVQDTRADLLQEVQQLRKRIDQLEKQGSERSQMIDPPLKSEPVLTSEPVAEVDMLALRERYRRAFELSKEGLSYDEIAKRLGAGRGEIDLIFSLAAKNERGQADA
ncbi:DUF6115 domain-containing protein [Brevibacillus reuszeri]|uniref:RNA polymerase subunit sigma-70 n=2 Tax=Brevibacillus reuszeri TaxID=54915 RepID=A0A0K9YVN5_9BACL|nr:sigma factor-like helix-turn-helix DNA-binding protein [Brevibacillus reuszeri]KNB72753.1 RNA polymerase subunit sigma-70 [Brevibacillus reuszeri]MED1860542.1 sigma factor-like helix-turn-helix DNA-binding protein [Brevibacillus reuszeri]